MVARRSEVRNGSIAEVIRGEGAQRCFSSCPPSAQINPRIAVDLGQGYRAIVAL
jgi:hypothetical protein